MSVDFLPFFVDFFIMALVDFVDLVDGILLMLLKNGLSPYPSFFKSTVSTKECFTWEFLVPA